MVSDLDSARSPARQNRVLTPFSQQQEISPGSLDAPLLICYTLAVPKNEVLMKNIKKDICLFFTSEEAKILKKDIVKLGLSATTIAMVMGQQGVSHAKSPEDGASPDVSICHSDAVMVQHSSVPVYDEECRCGGHSSTIIGTTHINNVQHADS